MANTILGGFGGGGATYLTSNATTAYFTIGNSTTTTWTKPGDYQTVKTDYLNVYQLRVIDLSPSKIVNRFVLDKRVCAKGDTDLNSILISNGADIEKALDAYNTQNKSEVTLDDCKVDLKYIENFALKSAD